MINRASMLPEMLSCTDMTMTVLERQRARFKWQPDHNFQQVQHQNQEDSSYFGEFNDVFELQNQQQQQQGFQGGDLGEIVIRSVKPDPGLMDNSGWSSSNTHDLVGFGNFDMNFAISRTTSCPPTVLEAAAAVEAAADLAKPRDTVAEKLNSGKKRKLDQKAQNNNNIKVVAGDETCRDKRSKASAQEGESSNSKNSNKENSAETSKVTDVQKPDYIHVRARRGQATDSHSLAERVRREKISERMKYLQDLVPGCNKITGKAGMLDEIINYVQSLQRQVEFLSMKLAAINPRLDFNIDNLFAKEEFPPCPTNFPAIGDMSTNSAFFQLNPVQQQQLVACCGLEMGINPSDLGLRRTISAPVSVPESFIDSSCFNQITPSSSTWNADLQNLYNVAFDQGRSAPFSTQQFTGTIEASEMKMEM